MKLLDDNGNAGNASQLSFSFEASTNATAGRSQEVYELPRATVAPAIEAPIGVILSFPQDRRTTGNQSQLIQNILQRYRFF